MQEVLDLPFSAGSEMEAAQIGYSLTSLLFSPFIDRIVGMGRGGGAARGMIQLFQSFLQEALFSSSGMGRDVHSLKCPPSGVAHLPR